MNANGATGCQFRQIGEVIREESIRNAIYAELEGVGVGGRCNGVGAGLLLSIWVGRYGREELACCEGKGLPIVNDKVEMEALRRLGNARLACQTCSV